MLPCPPFSGFLLQYLLALSSSSVPSFCHSIARALAALSSMNHVVPIPFETNNEAVFFFFSILGLFIYRVSVIFKSDQRLPKRECFRYFQRSTVTDKTVISCMQMLVSCLQTMEDDGGLTGPIVFHSNKDEVLSATKQSFS